MRTTKPSVPSSPEERIIRELYRAKNAGLTASNQASGVGSLLETLLLRELQSLSARMHDEDIRFARGWVVENYGTEKSEGASATNAAEVSTSSSPRFDIVCYRGDVAWKTHGGVPHALVPATFTRGVLEAKRTLSPGYFSVNSSRGMNEQLIRQRKHLDQLGVDGPLVIVGAHHRGTPAELREEAAADAVAPLGDLANQRFADKMAREGELARIVNLLTEQPDH